MKKRVSAELISIAHRILKLKNNAETIQLQLEAKNLYEQLTVLRFYEENFELVKNEISQEVLEEKLAAKPLAIAETPIKAIEENKDDEVEHSGFPRSLFFGPPEPALTRAASIVPYFAQNFAPKVPSDVQKFRPEILSEKIEKNA